MSEQTETIIVFDNLLRPTDVLGQYKGIEAKSPEPFSNSNAPGSPKNYESLDQISELAVNSAERVRSVFAS